MINTLFIFFIPTKYDPPPLIVLSNPPISIISSPDIFDICLIFVRKVLVCTTQIPFTVKIYNSVYLEFKVIATLE